MLKLGPRKHIDPAKMPKTSKPVPAFCAFCKAKIARAKAPQGPTSTATGKCGCGALYVSDGNGKLGGEALLAGLQLPAGGDADAAMGLREGVDYETGVLAYDERKHEVDVSVDPRRYGIGRMWYFRALPSAGVI